MKINQKLKNRRKELDLTMFEVAQKVGVSEATVSRWESGDIANMRRDKIVALANALKVPPSYIMDVEAEQTPSEQSNAIQHPLDPKSSTGILSSDEQQLVDGYRKLPLKGKEYLLTTLQFAKQQYEVTDTETEEVAILQLSEKEKELIKQIRGFDEHIRNDLLKYIADLYRDRDEIPKPNSSMEEKAN